MTDAISSILGSGNSLASTDASTYGSAPAPDPLSVLFNSGVSGANAALPTDTLGTIFNTATNDASSVLGPAEGAPADANGISFTPSTPAGINGLPGVHPAPTNLQTAVPQAVTPVVPSTQSAAPISLEAQADPIPNASGDPSQVDATTMQGLVGNQPWWQKLLGTQANSGPLPEGVTAQGGQGSGVLGQITGGSGGDILKTLLGGGALVKDLISGNELPKGSNQLRTEAGTQAGLANSYAAQAQAEGQGLLPAGAQALVQQNLDANIAAIRTKYAGMGMTGSSAETQDINAARNESLAQTFAIGQQMAQTGLTEVSNASQMESGILEALMQAELGQQTQLGEALASFAGASTDANRPQAA